jgi:hypothetical protein
LLGVECDGFIEALSPMVQPGGAVMPDKGVVAGKVALCGINHLPGLSTSLADPHPIDHPRSRMVAAQFSKAAPAVILGSGQGFVKMPIGVAKDVPFNVVPKTNDRHGARAQIIASSHLTSGHRTPNTTTLFRGSHTNRGAQSSDCGKSRSA